MSKDRVGFWLLLSLIPTGFFTFIYFIGFLVVVDVDAEEPSTAALVWGLLFFIFLLYWWAALLVGLGLKVWGKVEIRRNFNEGQRYAAINGWHPISQTAWRSLKADGASMAVTQSVRGSGYTLNVQSKAGATTVPDFTKPLWALEFGDWLWERTGGENITPSTAEAQRQEWSRSLITVPNPHPPSQSL